MKKQIIALTVAAGLLMAGTGAAIAGGFQSEKGDLPGFKHRMGQKADHWGFMGCEPGKFEGKTGFGAKLFKEEHLYMMAERLNIPTEGRAQEEIAADVKAAMQEKGKERLYKMAERLNIPTEGLTPEEVAKAVREASPKKLWKKGNPQE